MLVSNENLLFPAPNSGYSGITFTGGSTVITAYIGTTQLGYATSGANTFNITGYTGGINPDLVGPVNPNFNSQLVFIGSPIGSGNTYTISAPSGMIADTDTVTFTIAVRNAVGTEITLTRNIRYSLARAGIRGIDGNPGAPGAPGAPGDPGARGSLTGYAIRYNMFGAWDDAIANRVINNMVTNQTLSTNLTTTGHLRIGDTVIITNNSTVANSTDAVTKYWDGSSWQLPGVVFNGNVLVNGTITADKLAANSVLIGHQIKNAAGTFVIDFGSSPFISISV